MHGRLVVNPSSGTNRALGLLPEIHERLRALVSPLDITISLSAADVEQAAVRAVAERADALVIAGGDGTLNLALRALLGTGSGTLPTVGVVPLGTGNDFAKALGLGEDPLPAVERIAQGRVLAADVGVINGRPFANTSAGGFVADVSHALTEELKDVAGKAAYLVGGARALWSNESFLARLDVTAPELDVAGRWVAEHPIRMFAACNARHIGGGYPIAPAACIDDGLLDVFVVGDMPLLEFVGVLQRFAAGTHLEDERVLRFRTARFHLTFDRQVRVNTDGEPFETAECHYDVLPHAVPFFCGEMPHTAGSPRVG